MSSHINKLLVKIEMLAKRTVGYLLAWKLTVSFKCLSRLLVVSMIDVHCKWRYRDIVD